MVPAPCFPPRRAQLHPQRKNPAPSNPSRRLLPVLLARNAEKLKTVRPRSQAQIRHLKPTPQVLSALRFTTNSSQYISSPYAFCHTIHSTQTDSRLCQVHSAPVSRPIHPQKQTSLWWHQWERLGWHCVWGTWARLWRSGNSILNLEGRRCETQKWECVWFTSGTDDSAHRERYWPAEAQNKLNSNKSKDD